MDVSYLTRGYYTIRLRMCAMVTHDIFRHMITWGQTPFILRLKSVANLCLNVAPCLLSIQAPKLCDRVLYVLHEKLGQAPVTGTAPAKNV